MVRGNKATVLLGEAAGLGDYISSCSTIVACTDDARTAKTWRVT